MTLDEAHLILNTKREEALEAVLKVCLVPDCRANSNFGNWTELRAPIQNEFATTPSRNGQTAASRQTTFIRANKFTLPTIQGS